MALSRRPTQQLHGYVSPEALAGWHRFAQAHNTNVTALLEAMGVEMGTVVETPKSRLPPLLRTVIQEAQRIAGSRSSRATSTTEAETPEETFDPDRGV
jgi:hypothetical protein